MIDLQGPILGIKQIWIGKSAGNENILSRKSFLHGYRQVFRHSVTGGEKPTARSYRLEINYSSKASRARKALLRYNIHIHTGPIERWHEYRMRIRGSHIAICRGICRRGREEGSTIILSHGPDRI